MLEFLGVIAGFAGVLLVFLIVICAGFILIPAASVLGDRLERWLTTRLNEREIQRNVERYGAEQ